MARQCGSERKQKYGSKSKGSRRTYACGGKMKYKKGGVVRGGGAATRGLRYNRAG